MKNRCPSGFQAAVEQKFKISGGIYILKYLMITEQVNMTILLMTVLKRDYLTECISCKMVLRHKETGIHHSYYTVTITEPKIQIKTNVFLNLISVTAKKSSNRMD